MGKGSKRPYKKRKRAEAEEETRRRITEAAVELHGTVGPAHTTVTDVADMAGVSRMTVYNHFPTDADLFVACSSHWASQNPFPDPERWTEVADARDRLFAALEELYDWYRRKQTMVSNILRDAPVVPALGELMDGMWGGYMDSVVSALSAGWDEDSDDGRARRTTIRVVVDFNTWRLLDDSGLDASAAAELATEMVFSAAAAAPR